MNRTEQLNKFAMIVDANSQMLPLMFPPRVVIEPPEKFKTQTAKAALDTTGEKIGINSKYLSEIADDKKNPYTAWIILSHECRHAYQVHNGENFANYFVQNGDVDEYNSQLEEVDAWAWSFYVCGALFGIRPTLPSISPTTLEKILARTDEIVAERKRRIMQGF